MYNNYSVYVFLPIYIHQYCIYRYRYNIGKHSCFVYIMQYSVYNNVIQPQISTHNLQDSNVLQYMTDQQDSLFTSQEKNNNIMIYMYVGGKHGPTQVQLQYMYCSPLYISTGLLCSAGLSPHWIQGGEMN